MRKFFAASLFLAIAACGQAAAPGAADAQTGAAAPSNSQVTPAERSAILTALNHRANAQGQVENECGDWVAPQFVVAEVGAGPGRVVAFVIGGGPSMASCYGDGPLVTMLRQHNGAWSQIHQIRGGMAIVLPTQHNNGNDIADGGPGFSFPVHEWNGSTYIYANRQVSDSALNDARFIPN